MKQPTPDLGLNRRGFTLIELLVVISIIGILAGLLLPVLAKQKQRAQVMVARKEVNDIVGAITAYYGAYSRYPASTLAVNSVANSTVSCPDFTYGTTDNSTVLRNKQGQPLVSISNVGNNGYKAHNAEIVAILRDNPDIRINGFAPNDKHSKNPEKHVFLNAKQVSDIRQPGIGPDGVFRDPWSNPYIITIDLNYDEKCWDAFYRMDRVSQDRRDATGKLGLNGLVRSATSVANSFEARTPVMAWSLGPDGRADASVTPADQGVNKDNVLSWK